MHTNARFHSIGTTSDFGTKFAQNCMNDKIFEKINIKIVVSIYSNVPLHQISVSLENFKFWNHNCPKKYE